MAVGFLGKAGAGGVIDVGLGPDAVSGLGDGDDCLGGPLAGRGAVPQAERDGGIDEGAISPLESEERPVEGVGAELTVCAT